MESAEIRTWIYSLISGWLLVLGLLLLVDSQRIRFIVFSHGIYQSTVISVNPVILWVTLSTVLLWILLAYLRGLGSRVLIPGLPLVAFTINGQAAVGLAALTVFVLVIHQRDVNRQVTTCLISSLGLFSAMTLLHWLVLYPHGQETVLSELALFEAKAYYLWAMLAPWAYLSLFTAFLLRGLQLLFSPSVEVDAPRGAPSLLVLGVLCLLSSCLVLYTMLPGVSPGGIEAGVDFQEYVRQLQTVEGDSWMFLRVLRGERPFLFLLLHASRSLLGTGVVETLTYAPLVLNPLLVLSVYLFTWQVYRDGGRAMWASFFTVFGSTFSVAYFSYFLSNLLGLSLVLISLTLLFRALEKRGVLSLIGAILFGGLTLFTHPWTFVHYLIPLLGTLIWLGLAELRAGRMTLRSGYLVICAVAAVAFELFKSQFLGLYGGVAAFRAFTSSLSDPTRYVTHLIDGTRIRFGGFMANPVIIALAFIGIFYLKYRNERDLYLILLFTATAAGFLLGAEVVKSRFIFNAPLYILAGLGLEQIFEKGLDRRLTVSALVLYLGAILLRSLASVY
jgi:hypothetical protein